MTGFIMKLIICPIVVIISDALLNSVNYASIYQSIGVGIVLAVFAHMMEVLILREGTFWISTIADFIAALGVVYLSQFVLYGAVVTFAGALITSLLLAITEYFQHVFLINAGKTKKSE
ncbi:DUF2512 family protein [Petroclostridium sp. X23]|uniref:DUF2512 family protein n=1 Tax=Petroclostridium sp. X23 TaxID=3045146 RepID=UPI0024ADCFEC|nr:DUF2512 family protein [Petroclostridium sp. X23]WHH60054.1 DUF2512 family protein [Petroclostridium sp. X23]